VFDEKEFNIGCLEDIIFEECFVYANAEDEYIFE